MITRLGYCRAVVLALCVALLTTTVSAGDITTGLVAYYKLNETSGTTTSDSSGNNNTGTLQNFPVGPWVAGKVNGGLRFDGVDDMVSTPDAPNLQIPGDITIAFWMKKASEQPDWVRMVGKGNYAPPADPRNYGVWEEPGTATRILFQQYGAGASFFSNTGVPLDVWTHVCCVRAGTYAAIYINGYLDNTVVCAAGSAITSNDPLTLGKIPGIHTFYSGDLDEVRVFSRALSAADIIDLVNYADVPAITKAIAVNTTQVDLTFTTPLEAASANATANYTLNGGVTVTSAVRQPDLKTVRLTVAGMLSQVVYTLNVANVRSNSTPAFSMAPQQFNIMVDATLLDGNLIAQYQFEETAGTQADDSSANAYHGTYIDGATRGPGKNGALTQGVVLNGSNNRVHTPSSPPFKYIGGNNSYSLWCFINGTEVDGANLISKPWNGGGQYNVRIILNGARTVSFALTGMDTASPPAGRSYTLTTAAVLSVGAWHHVAGTLDSAGNATLYLDGVQAATGNYTASIPRWAPATSGDQNTVMTIGSLYPYGAGTVVPTTFTLDGRMDDVRFYSRVISAAEITSLNRDLPTISIAATDPLARETGGNLGVYRVSRTSSTVNPLTVQLQVGGTATLGVDYNLNGGAVTNSVVIPAGQSFVDITLTPIDDPNGEPTETAILTIGPDLLNYNRAQPLSATVNIDDDEAIISVLAIQPQASERGPLNGAFLLTRSNNIAGALTVTYTISGTATNGTDYQTISTSVNFAAGQTTANIIVTPFGDALGEGNETVILTINPGPGQYSPPASNSDTVTILDRSLVTIQATDPDAYEVGPNPGVITLTRTGPFDLPLTVPYTVSGTAIAGTDYETLSGVATFAPGESTVALTITPIDDTVLGLDSIVTISIVSNGDFAAALPNSASVTIHTDPEIFSGSGGITMTPNPALAGHEVLYSGGSGAATVVAWQWVFGDGSTATGQQAAHTYAQPGEYEVTVSATLADGSVSIGKRLLFVGTAVDSSVPGSGAASPSGGLLVGGSGITKQAGGKLRIRFSRRQVMLSAKLGNLMFDELLGQYSMQGRQGWLTIGPEANRQTYFFVLDGKGAGSSAEVPKMQVSLKKRFISFTVTEPGLTEFLGTLGASRTAPAAVITVPITVRVADKIFVAFTLTMDFKARNDSGAGTLRKR